MGEASRGENNMRWMPRSITFWYLTVCPFLLDLREREICDLLFLATKWILGPKSTKKKKERKKNTKWIKFGKRQPCQFLVGWLTSFHQPSGHWVQKNTHQKKKKGEEKENANLKKKLLFGKKPKQKQRNFIKGKISPKTPNYTFYNIFTSNFFYYTKNSIVRSMYPKLFS